MNQDLAAYYHQRAKEYDKVYENPAEQPDLRRATAIFQALFAQKRVLEMACGTGYWTAQIAQTATSVHATDVNESVLHIAQGRQLGEHVTFAVADMYALMPAQRYDGLFAGFIWSHLLHQDLDAFLEKVKQCVRPGGTFALIDSNPVPGTKHDLQNIAQTDAHGNTYQRRTLEDGSSHLVLKNFPTESFLREKLATIATDFQFYPTEYYWIVRCTLC